MHKPLFLRPGTPISQIGMSELPSPRLVTENDRLKNARLLPHYDGPDTTDWPSSKLDLVRRRVQRRVANLRSVGSTSEGQARLRQDQNQALEQQKIEREQSKHVRVNTDLKVIVDKAIAMAYKSRNEDRGGCTSQVFLTHMGSKRMEKSFLMKLRARDV